MRYYVGLDCHKPELLAYQATFDPVVHKLCDPLHITLKMLFDLDDITAVHQALTKVHAQHVKITTTGLHTFSKPHATRLITLDVQKAKELLALQQKVTRALSSLFTPEQSYHPHITILRPKKPFDMTALEQPPTFTFTCNTFHLYEKRQDKYKIIRTYKLQ